VGMHPARTLDEFTDQVAALAVQVLDYYGSKARLVDVPDLPCARRLPPPRYLGARNLQALRTPPDPLESVVSTEPLIVSLRYPEGVALLPDQRATLRLRLENPSEVPVSVDLSFQVPHGWYVEPNGCTAEVPVGKPWETELQVTAPPASSLRVYRNPLDIRMTIHGLHHTVSAGLIQTIPWRHWTTSEVPAQCPEVPSGAERVEVQGHFLPLQDGPQVWVTDLKLPYHATLRYIAQAPREVKVWLDDELILEHSGRHRLPAVHRCGETGKDVPRKRGWQRLCVATGDGAGGELFIAVGDGQSWDWLRDAEWRDPATQP